ncbi:MAG: cytochrome c biogenesis protein ResB [Planctomycetaceae bacterium]|jgi:hypothetical protein|nr:cytochrome c biogenesis protein ResB [Planctomycetaceae bacterium]
MRNSRLFPFLAAAIRQTGSLFLGIVLLIIILILLAWGTFIESEYGAAVSRFVLYGNPCFAFLLLLLAVNILAHIVSRFPWEKSDLPFLTVHCGILILFFGCFQTWNGGEEAQITLPEGTIGNTASRPEQQQITFELTDHTAAQPSADTPKIQRIPFRPGPFSWDDYQYDHWIKNSKPYQTTLWYAMQTARRDHGQIPTGDPSVQLEVLDYYADSLLEPAPPLELNIRRKGSGFSGKQTSAGEWESVRLEQKQPVHGFDVRGASATMSQGERVSYSTALCKEELIAFLTAGSLHYGAGQSVGHSHSSTILGSGAEITTDLPDRTAGPYGTVILHRNNFRMPIDAGTLIALAAGQRVPLKEFGLEIGNVQFKERGPILHFTLYTKGGEQESMTLFPDNPEMNVHARRLGVFGSYWINPYEMMSKNAALADHPVLKRAALPRLDFMQGPDCKLYYRLRAGQKSVSGEVSERGNTAIKEFLGEGTAGGEMPNQKGSEKLMCTIAQGMPYEVDVAVEKFVPHDCPGSRIVPKAAEPGQHKETRIKLRAVFDGNESTFWLRAVSPTVIPLPPQQDQIRYLYGKNRTLCVQLDFEKIDLGFGIFLKKFEQRTEPGTRMPSHFSSLVDYVQPVDPAMKGIFFSRSSADFSPLPGGENVRISMNRPGYCRGTGKGWRIYQSSYLGPFYPDQPQFHELYDGSVFPWETKPRESIAMSTLSVNADPGRGWKYFGCFLLVLGTALFMRKNPGQNRREPDEVVAKPPAAETEQPV